MTGFRVVRPATAFANAEAPRQRRPRRRAPQHLAWIRTLPCVICETRGNCHAAHLRAAAPQYGKRATGLSEKPDDCWALPLCPDHHLFGDEAQHKGNELAFWRRFKRDPFVLSLALWRATGDDEAAEAIMRCSWGK